MPNYSVSYDLIKHKNYGVLYERLNALPGAVKELDSLWFVPNYPSAAALGRYLEDVLDHDDKLVIRVVGHEVHIRPCNMAQNAFSGIVDGIGGFQSPLSELMSMGGMRSEQTTKIVNALAGYSPKRGL
jgi:hypothetical protein